MPERIETKRAGPYSQPAWSGFDKLNPADTSLCSYSTGARITPLNAYYTEA